VYGIPYLVVLNSSLEDLTTNDVLPLTRKEKTHSRTRKILLGHQLRFI
jgi:hypothetical protein